MKVKISVYAIVVGCMYVLMQFCVPSISFLRGFMPVYKRTVIFFSFQKDMNTYLVIYKVHNKKTKQKR